MSLDQLLDTMPYIPCVWQFTYPDRTYDLAVVHCMETVETEQTAEALGAYFAYNPTIISGARKASVHVGTDSNSAVRYAPDTNYVYGAGGANRNGLHIELAGYSAQSESEWLDAFGTAMLPIAASVVAAWCNRYLIPPTFLDAAALQACAAAGIRPRGITTHHQVTLAYHQDDHTDPGPSFPLDYFIKLVHMSLAEEIAKAYNEYPITVHSYNEDRDITIPRYQLDAYSNMELQRIRKLLESR